ncbi:acyl-CoA thioesterase II [Bradyrhizobium sp. WD16]|uniref:acyl-CoA thioesterase n=1 Tax=Bradyrhizobium sp. WD16 TaxID=1521768 RepID=UPI0020A5FF01|nr:thioesterase family protein [Bradyrhizobium sp. WD16]UTD27397.1 acyl-CoA thioesterase [Bradyrhizobium sp. WD16]
MMSQSENDLHPLENATRLTWHDGHWRGHTSPDYWAFIGPFGGATAATLLRAVLDHPDRIGDPLALTVNYCAPIAEGQFQIAIRAAKTNRSTQHWTMELCQQDGEALATATAVFAVRRPTWNHAVARIPHAPAPQTLARFENKLSRSSWIDRYDMRFVGGNPAFGATPQSEPQPADTLLWLRDAEPRRLDYLSLVSMSDAFFGRVFHILGVLVPFGTVTLTTYFHGGAQDMVAENDWVLGRAGASVFRNGFGDQSVELWAPDGRLLTTSIQATYYRDWKPADTSD